MTKEFAQVQLFNVDLDQDLLNAKIQDSCFS